MGGKFQWKKISDLDIEDPIFDSLKEDYPGNEQSTGFNIWFEKKKRQGDFALVFNDQDGLGAFICMKEEEQELILKETVLPPKPRIKISTLKLAERFRGQRLGEGAIGLILWEWQRSGLEGIYITIFPKQDVLIGQLEKFGFQLVGYNSNQECVYLRERQNINYEDPYKSFPFINPEFKKAGYLIVEDDYHDTLFPYSELKNTLQEQLELNVANGLSKIYIGKKVNSHYKIGEPILIYRKYTKKGSPYYKSCITSFCVVTDIIIVKKNGKILMKFDDLMNKIGNKSIFNEDEIKKKYNNDKNLIIVDMLYYGYFGAGNNVNCAWLTEHGYMGQDRGYPMDIYISNEEFRTILKAGEINVSNVIID